MGLTYSELNKSNNKIAKINFNPKPSENKPIKDYSKA
jgi:hypothetical protein